MNKLKLIKITLLIIILAEEIRSAKGKVKYDYDSFNEKNKRSDLNHIQISGDDIKINHVPVQNLLCK
ncbi:hypothetical protein RSA37_11675 [Mammaliicoccus sciuri]|nr:hypothetical protein NS1R_11935 [Mammaliicoccus sciuri]KTT88251.1 hypothetical protein NS112_09555 [Mammaliicoccus sciuri]KTT89794.1 hypothetical protein NS36R_08080 [Mammaliicoccus sciuri]KTT94186.1 hypothetical protein NS44R_08495 [Mammaliicoccus sciuri]KTW10708.1 hypothetical protein RSA37_11675 [Mammaliicoccus sciuri]